MYLSFLFSSCSLVPEVYQWGPLGRTQTQAWDDTEIWTSQDRLCHYCRFVYVTHTALLFLFVKYPFPAIKWRLFSIPQHQWAPTIIPLLGIFSSHNLKKSSSIDTFSAKCESVTWNSYFCSFFFARPDTYSHPLPKELRGGRSVQWAGQLLWARRGWQESKELCKKGLVLLLLSVSLCIITYKTNGILCCHIVINYFLVP